MSTRPLRRFVDRVALVTGAASGIGWATAERLAAEGARLWLVDVRADALRERARVLPSARVLGVDVTVPEEVDAAIDAVVRDGPGLDVVVNCVGATLGAAVQDTQSDDWERILRVNLTGAFNLTRAAMRHMIVRRSGAIVHVASDAGLVGMPSQAAYCASKGGLVHFARACALDAAPHDVRINCVCPCFIATPLLDAWIATQPDPERALAECAAEQPIGRIGQPGEVAAAIAFLASDEARFITGIALPVDGGVSAQ